MTQWCVEEAIFERFRVATTPDGETDEVESMSPGERQQMEHTVRMAALKAGG